MVDRLLCVAALLMIGFVGGCAGEGARAVSTPLEGDVFEVQRKLYVVGARWGRPETWFIAPPDWGLERGTNRRMLESLIEEYQRGDDTQAKYSAWKIYGTLKQGDRIRVAKSNWVEAGTDFSGYLTKAEVLTGPYAGQQLDLHGLVLSEQTGKPVEDRNPYEDSTPSPQRWKLDPRYLQKVGRDE